MGGRSRLGVTGAAGAVASALLLVACGAGPAPSAEDRKSCVSSPAGGTVESFQGPSYDYDPLRSPDELAKQSELIVSGTISAVREGRTTVFPANEQIKASTTTVVVIADVTAVRGQPQAGNDGSVYLELHGLNHPDPAHISRALPGGARVVAYLVPAWDGTPRAGTDGALANPAAGRPAGQGLYLPAGPQGLAIQVAEGNVVWPLIGAQAPGCIADALPGGNLIGQ